MKHKKLFLIPLFLLIIALITSVIAFDYSKKLEKGYIYSDEEEAEITYTGSYIAIIGNLGENSEFVKIMFESDFISVTIVDVSETIIKDYKVLIYEKGTVYDSTIIGNKTTSGFIKIDDLDEYLFTIQLEQAKTYTLDVIATDDNVIDDPIDFALVHLPEQYLNMNGIMESISFTTAIFSAISLFTIFAVIYSKK